MNIAGIVCMPDGQGGTMATVHFDGNVTEAEVRKRLGDCTPTQPILGMSAGKDVWRTIPQAAKELHISAKSIYNAIAEGKLKCVLPPTNTERYRLVNLRDIENLMKKGAGYEYKTREVSAMHSVG